MWEIKQETKTPNVVLQMLLSKLEKIFSLPFQTAFVVDDITTIIKDVSICAIGDITTIIKCICSFLNKW
jgi:hypothetical protein